MNACAAKDFYLAILELFGYSFYFDSLQATKTCVTGIAFKELHKSLFFVFDKPFVKEKKNFDFCFLFGINFNKEISNQIPKKHLFWGFRFILSKTSFIWQNKHPMSFIQNWIPHFWLKELFWTNLFIFSPKQKIKRQCMLCFFVVLINHYFFLLLRKASNNKNRLLAKNIFGDI